MSTSYALRVLHIMRTPVGGLFRHVCDLAEEQAKRGCHVGVICDSLTGGDRADEALAKLEDHLALGLHRLPISRAPHPSDLKAFRSVRAIANATRADILHGHGAKGGAFSRLVTAFKGSEERPVGAFYTPHGGTLHYDPKSLQGRLFFAFERWASSKTASILFESHYGLNVFKSKVGTPHCSVDVIHNGLRPSEFESVKSVPEPYDLLYIGELRDLKGVDVLLQALARARRFGSNFKALLVGAGPDEQKFRTLSDELGLTGSVTFSAPMPAREAFSLANCVVVPSRKESLPYVVLEACAAGLPLVSTNVGGIPEIFGDEQYRLIPPDDSAALATTLMDTLGNLAAARTRAEALKDRLETAFSVETMTTKILEAYGSRSQLAPEASDFFANH